MADVFTILRTAREGRHLTLADVADATLINIEHLRAIDDGHIDILPEAYVRAFMREYAVYVGLDPSEVMQLFDAERGVKTKPAGHADDEIPPLRGGGETDPPAGRPKHHVGSGEYTRTVVTLVGLAVAAVIAWNLLGTARVPVRTTPFREVVRENEERAGVTDESTTKGATASDSIREGAANGDSLTLSARTTDSVWVRMMVDDSGPREYLFRPKEKITWRGRSQFLFFTIGNGGAIELTLNGKLLGPAGKPGRVVQKLVINRKGIEIPGSETTVRKDDGSADSATESTVPLDPPRGMEPRRR